MSPSVGEWTSIGPTRIGPAATGVLFSIVIEPSAPEVVYVGSPFCGVWMSEDAAVSWRPVGDSLPGLDVAALAIDPSIPGRIYAALPSAGIFRSDDGAGTWSPVGAA